MPLLGQPDASIYNQVEPIAWPGQGKPSAQQGPNAALVRLGLEEQENEQIRQLAQQYGTDYDGLVDAVSQLNPKRGFEMKSALEQSRKDAAAKSIEETKGSIQKLDMGARWLQTAAEQPDLWPVIRGELLKQAGQAAPTYDKVLPQLGDPDLSDKLTKLVTGIALPTKDYLEVKNKAAQLYFDGKKVEGALTLLAGSKTPEQWQHSAEIVKGGGLGQLLGTVPDAAAAQAMLASQQEAKPDADKPEKLIAQTTGGLTGAAGLELAQYMKAHGITDPLDPRLTGVINKIRAQEKQAITIVTPGAAPADVAGAVRTTLSGKKYLDMSDFETPKDKAAARAQAQKLGVMAVDAKTGASLKAIDSAKQNAMTMWRQISQFLPKDPAGRILGGPKNTLAQIFQTHPELGAYGAWRTAAIQQVQALAEPGMGLRINQAEIKAAMENDIPQITDDGPTAAQRLKNLMTMLNNKENDALTRDRSSLLTDTQSTAVNPFKKK